MTKHLTVLTTVLFPEEGPPQTQHKVLFDGVSVEAPTQLALILSGGVQYAGVSNVQTTAENREIVHQLTALASRLNAEGLATLEQKLIELTQPLDKSV